MRIPNRFPAWLALFIVLAMAPVPAWSAKHAVFDESETKNIERIIRDYLMKNPEVILEAVQVLEVRQRQTEQKRLQDTIASSYDEIARDPGSPVAGNPDGDVAVVEFFDYQCTYCKATAPRLARLLADDEEIRFVYKEWPILGPASVFAAKAALAVRNQGKYKEFHDKLMSVKGKLNECKVLDTADRLGLDMEQLKRDMEASEVQAIIRRNKALAARLGITGTPAFVIGDQLIRGAASLAQLRATVKQARDGS